MRVQALRVQGLTSNGVTLQGFGLRVLGLGRFFLDFGEDFKLIESSGAS